MWVFTWFSGVADKENLCWCWATLIVGFSVFGVLILILAVEFGQILSLTCTIDVDVGSNLIGWILHHYGFYRGLPAQNHITRICCIEECKIIYLRWKNTIKRKSRETCKHSQWLGALKKLNLSTTIKAEVQEKKFVNGLLQPVIRDCCHCLSLNQE